MKRRSFLRLLGLAAPAAAVVAVAGKDLPGGIPPPLPGSKMRKMVRSSNTRLGDIYCTQSITTVDYAKLFGEAGAKRIDTEIFGILK